MTSRFDDLTAQWPHGSMHFLLILLERSACSRCSVPSCISTNDHAPFTGTTPLMLATPPLHFLYLGIFLLAHRRSSSRMWACLTVPEGKPRPQHGVYLETEFCVFQFLFKRQEWAASFQTASADDLQTFSWTLELKLNTCLTGSSLDPEAEPQKPSLNHFMDVNVSVQVRLNDQRIADRLMDWSTLNELLPIMCTDV